MLKSLLAIAIKWSREKIAIFILKPRSHVRMLIYIYIERGRLLERIFECDFFFKGRSDSLNILLNSYFSFHYNLFAN